MAEAMEEKQKKGEESAAMEDSEKEKQFEDIDKLQEHGVNMTDIKKLKAEGLYTIASLMMSTKKNLTAIKGLSDNKIDKILLSAAKVQDFGFTTGSEVLRKRKSMLKVTTGSSALDELLQGGIESMGITEVFGEFRTGKTQLCHTLCVTAQLPSDQKGGNGKVVFIDTEANYVHRGKGALAVSWLQELKLVFVNKFGVDGNQVLDNILYARAFTHEHQMKLLAGVAAKMIEEHYSLVVVDSATALFRVDFMGRGQLADRQQKLGQFMSKLQKISEEFNVVVLITNQVVSDPGGGMAFAANLPKPIGGNIMAHSSTTRLFLRKGRAEQRVCKIYDSPCLPESEAIFQLTEGGIANAKD